MTKATTRRFFWGGTVVFTLIFIGLTIHTHTTIDARTNADALSEEVVRGLKVWERYNCENCHTLMGEGAYYAPDLTKIVEQRGAPYLESFMADPSLFYSAERDGRLMPDLGMSQQEISDVIAFLRWVGNVDLNGWPPRPILVAGVSVRGMPGVEGVRESPEPVLRGKAIFHEEAGCASCHAVSGETTLVGSSMAGIPQRARRRIESGAYTGEADTPAAYIRESILHPSAFIADAPEGRSFTTAGGQSLMPEDYGQRLSDEQIDDLVAYLMSLREDER
ncbi:MAG: cytochrome c [Myxococcota bacterium]|nr:cytochrome c [Myxococcota bacterium]